MSSSYLSFFLLSFNSANATIDKRKSAVQSVGLHSSPVSGLFFFVSVSVSDLGFLASASAP